MSVTFEQVRDALIATKGMQYLAAKKLGCTANSVCNWMKRWPALREVRALEMEKMLDVAEGKLFAGIEAGLPWAVIFTLKTQGRHRGYVQRSELTGENGTPIQTTVIETIVHTRQDARDILSRLGGSIAIPSRN